MSCHAVVMAQLKHKEMQLSAQEQDLKDKSEKLMAIHTDESRQLQQAKYSLEVRRQAEARGVNT